MKLWLMKLVSLATVPRILKAYGLWFRSMGNRKPINDGERIMRMLVEDPKGRKRVWSQMRLGMYNHTSRFLLSLTPSSSTGGIPLTTRLFRCERMIFRFTCNSARKLKNTYVERWTSLTSILKISLNVTRLLRRLFRTNCNLGTSSTRARESGLLISWG